MEKTQEQLANDLALIRSMMASGRKKAGIDGIFLMLWGGLLMVTFYLQYMAVYHYIPDFGWKMWLGCFILGWAGSFWVGWRTQRSVSENNFALTAYSAVWRAVGIIMLLYFLTAIAFDQFDAKIITILTAATFGGGMYVIAKILNAKALYLPAIGWWLILIYSTYIKEYSAEMLLIMAGACGLLVFLPGLIMRRFAAEEDNSSD